jgi:hypothetical protein
MEDVMLPVVERLSPAMGEIELEVDQKEGEVDALIGTKCTN